MKKLLLTLALAAPSYSQVGWTALPNTAIKPSLCPGGATGDCAMVVEAWSGAVADTLRNRLVIFGGGHGNYNGNEVYALYPPGTTPQGVQCSSTTAPAMCRIKDPSASLRSLTIGAGCFPDETDGTANGRHTYNGEVYIANRDKMYVAGGSLACSDGFHKGDTWTLDMPTLAWSRRDPTTSTTLQPSDICNGGGCSNVGQGPWTHSAYDPVSKLVLHSEALYPSGAGAYIWTYNDATKVYTRIANSIPVATNSSWVVDPVHRRLYMIGNTDNAGIGNATTSAGTYSIRYISLATLTQDAVTTSTAVTDPNCNVLGQATAPGLVWWNSINKIVGWPNFGNTIYILDPVTNTCTSQTYPGGPPDSTNALGAVETTGTYGRFGYFPALDAGFIVNDGSTNAYMLKLPSNTMTITNNGTTTSNYPVQIGRAFAQGEIPNGSLPQASVNGSAVATQVDVKNRWPDSSLKFAIVSFLIPTFTASATHSVSFAAGTTVGNTALTQIQMLDPVYQFSVPMQLGKSGFSTITVDPRTMLTSGDYVAWASGPIATTILLGRHDQTVTCGGRAASTYDVGFGSFCSFRPTFEATFWPTINKVYVRVIGEVANTEQLQDVAVDSLTLKSGITSPVTWYTRGPLTMNAGTRWTKTTWIGGAPPSASYNHNIAYLAYSKALPNYDSSLIPKVTSAQITAYNSAWNASSKDLYGKGIWDIPLNGGGGHPHVGPHPAWHVCWLFTGDPQCQAIALGQSELFASMNFHFREGNTAKKMDQAGTIPGVGYPISIAGRPTLQSINGGLYGSPTSSADQMVSVGTITDPGWGYDPAHQPEAFISLYLTTGEHFWIEEEQFMEGYNASYVGNTGAIWVRRGPTGKEGGLADKSNQHQQLRGIAWSFRQRVETGAWSPDGTAIKAVIDQRIADAIAYWEGQRDITTSAYHGNTQWNFGHSMISPVGDIGFWDYYPSGDGGNFPVPTLHFWDIGNNGLCQSGVNDTSVTKSCVSTWWEYDMMYALGRGKELSYATSALLSWVAPQVTDVITDPSSNPWFGCAYRFNTFTTGNAYITTWAAQKSGMVSAVQTETACEPGGAGNSGTDQGNAETAIVASGYTVGDTNGQAAWQWVGGNIYPTIGSDPKWAILPRIAAAVAPACSIFPSSVGPYVGGQVVSTGFTQHNCTNGLNWSASGLGASGLALSTSGALTGTAVAGTYSVTIGYDTASALFTLTVNPAPALPVVSTTTASSITTTGATTGGNVTSDGGVTVTARGVCYATAANPTTPCTSNGTGTGAFTSILTGLAPSTQYHYRAYAVNSVGTSYGTDLTFTTGAASGGNNGGAKSNGKAGGKINR